MRSIANQVLIRQMKRETKPSRRFQMSHFALMAIALAKSPGCCIALTPRSTPSPDASPRQEKLLSLIRGPMARHQP